MSVSFKDIRVASAYALDSPDFKDIKVSATLAGIPAFTNIVVSSSVSTGTPTLTNVLVSNNQAPASPAFYGVFVSHTSDTRQFKTLGIFDFDVIGNVQDWYFNASLALVTEYDFYFSVPTILETGFYSFTVQNYPIATWKFDVCTGGIVYNDFYFDAGGSRVIQGDWYFNSVRVIDTDSDWYFNCDIIKKSYDVYFDVLVIKSYADWLYNVEVPVLSGDWYFRVPTYINTGDWYIEVGNYVTPGSFYFEIYREMRLYNDFIFDVVTEIIPESLEIFSATSSGGTGDDKVMKFSVDMFQGSYFTGNAVVRVVSKTGATIKILIVKIPQFAPDSDCGIFVSYRGTDIYGVYSALSTVKEVEFTCP